MRGSDCPNDLRDGNFLHDERFFLDCRWLGQLPYEEKLHNLKTEEDYVGLYFCRIYNDVFVIFQTHCTSILLAIGIQPLKDWHKMY